MKRILAVMMMVMVALAAVVPQAEATGYMVITNDDSSEASLAIAEVLKGLPVTGFAITGRVNKPGYLTLAQMKNLKARYKWEWQNHTDTHRPFTPLTDDEISLEIRTAKQKLRTWRLGNAVALAPPMGDYGEGEGNIDGHRLESIIEDEGSVTMCRQAYPQDSGDIETMINRKDAFDPMKIKVFSVKRSTVGTDPENIPEIFYDLVYAAREENALIVFVTHGVGDDPGNDYAPPAAVLKSMVAYIKSQPRTKLQVLSLTRAVTLFDR